MLELTAHCLTDSLHGVFHLLMNLLTRLLSTKKEKRDLFDIKSPLFVKITKVHEQSQKTQTSRTGGPSRRRAFSRLCALFCSGVRGVGGAARGFGFHCPPCQAEHLQAVGQWHHLLG